jgi:NCS1 family nucleobase:cation symporter-1
MFNVGDWGWLIGASAGAIIYRALSGESVQPMAVGAAE